MQEQVQTETWETRVEKVLSTMREKFSTSVKITTQAPAWNEFLAGHPRATLFHNPRWGRIMEQAYGNRPFYLTAHREGKVTGILQLVEQKSLLFGSHLCSLPYFDAVGILAEDEQVAGSLLEEAKKLVRQRKVKWAEIRQNSVSSQTLPCRTDKVDLRLELPACPEELWKALDTKVRNQVRKAQSAGLAGQSGRKELVDQFYQVYARNMRDLGSPPHHRRFFDLIAETFSDSVKVYIVRKENRTVAGALTLTDRRVFYVPWAASDWREKSSCPNMLLYWSMLEDSCRNGINLFDFGRSTRESGTYRFKTQWGAKEAPLYWQYLLAPGEKLPDLRPDNGKYRFLVQAWRRLPVKAAQLLGPCVISKLS
jgi:FemAB-related protein (PEP-CTERM system-associated)